MKDIYELQIKKIIQLMTVVQYEKDLLFLSKGEEATCLFIIKTGTVKIIDGDEVKHFKPFSTFGEIALSSVSRNTQYSAKAETSVEVGFSSLQNTSKELTCMSISIAEKLKKIYMKRNFTPLVSFLLSLTFTVSE